ncbi:MAG: hypothetical protein V3S71_02790 [Acidobacteriota bacterium]
MKRKNTKRTAPVCSKCGATGTGVLFSIFSKHGFGTYCDSCEAVVDRAIADATVSNLEFDLRNKEA